MGACEDLASRLTCCRVVLTTEPEMTAARRLYEELD